MDRLLSYSEARDIKVGRWLVLCHPFRELFPYLPQTLLSEISKVVYLKHHNGFIGLFLIQLFQSTSPIILFDVHTIITQSMIISPHWILGLSAQHHWFSAPRSCNHSLLLFCLRSIVTTISAYSREL